MPEAASATRRRIQTARLSGIPVRSRWLVGTCVVFVGCGVGSEHLSQRERAEYERLVTRMYVLCRHGPIREDELEEASRLTTRAIELTRKAPDDRWVTDPNDLDTGSTTARISLYNVEEALTQETPDCSRALARRAEQAARDIY